jgi:hypothetical protein
MEARVIVKREAQQRIVQMILTDEELTSETRMQQRVPDEIWAAASETDGND